MKRIFLSIAFAVLLVTGLPVSGWAAELLIPVGKVIGLQLEDGTVTVAAFDDLLGGNAKDAGLQIGDEIVRIDSTQVSCAGDIRQALKTCGDTLEVSVRRGSKLCTLRMTPARSGDTPKLGVFLRQGIAGIGTVTWYDPESGKFGTLGHGVSNGQGMLLNMTRGFAYEATVMDVRRGKSGSPGQLKGDADTDSVFGSLLRNTPQGVFGITKTGWSGEPLPVAAFSDVRIGPACIRSTVAGRDTQEYSVEICRIYPEDRSDGRNFLIKVTDPALLTATGGIVQGMSGSPIIQDGKLVGAVTHVLVNDPTRGYGIFIENMLEAASLPTNQTQITVG